MLGRKVFSELCYMMQDGGAGVAWVGEEEEEEEGKYTEGRGRAAGWLAGTQAC